eukprot:scaffold4069_cov85-Cyclotella_meneghiniana.AAC.5
MSQSTDAAIGMMDGAYFTSRKDILDFLNSTFDLNLSKIEQTASGAVACQLTEYLFPNSIPMWLKAFFDQTCGMMNGMRENYDPVAVRARGKGGKSVERSKAGGGRPAAARNAGAAAKAPRAAAVKAPRAAPPSVGRPASSTSRTTGVAARSKENIANTSSTTTSSSISTSKPRKAEDTAALKALQEENSRLQSKVADLETMSAELELNVHNSQAERDFYFHKLRGIEIMLQVFKDKEESGDAAVDLGAEARKVIERAFKVMYATDQDNIDVDDEGNIDIVFHVICMHFKQLIGDITSFDDSVDANNLSTVHAIDSSSSPREEEPIVEKEVEPFNQFSDEEEEELLTAGLDDEVHSQKMEAPIANNAALPLNQFSDDDEEDELLTAGLDDELPVKKMEIAVSPIKPILADDNSIEDENLLSD